MKKIILLLPLLFLVACGHAPLSISLKNQMLESPETTGKQFHPYIGIGSYGTSEVKVVKDIAAVPPSSSNAKVENDDNNSSLKIGIGLLERMDFIANSSSGDDAGMVGLKYNFIGGKNQPGYVFTAILSVYSGDGSSDTTDFFPSNHYYGHLDLDGLGATAMFGYKWYEDWGPYLTVSFIDYKGKIKVSQTISGTTTNYHYDDNGHQNIYGIGIFKHSDHISLVAEWTYTQTGWSRIPHTHDFGSLGGAFAYIF